MNNLCQPISSLSYWRQNARGCIFQTEKKKWQKQLFKEPISLKIWSYFLLKGNICNLSKNIQFSSVKSLSRVQFFVTPWIAAHQASLSITNSCNLPKLLSIELVMPSSHLIFCHPLLLPPPIPPSIRVFSNESTLRIRWPKYWSFSFSISPFNEYSGLISFRMTASISLQSKGFSRVFSNTTLQKHQFFSAQLFL